MGNLKIIDEIKFVADEENRRIDQYLYQKLGYSRSYFKHLIERGFVLINGKKCKPSSKILPGASCHVIIPDESIDLSPKEIAFGIIEDNEHYVVIDKPAGLVVHPAPGNKTDTLVNGILYRFVINDENSFRPGIVHRLDKDTSGVMVIAKNRDARQKLAEIFSNREVIKEYLAVCAGNPNKNEYVVENYIGRSPKNRQKMAVMDHGKFASSHIVILDRGKDIFLCRVRIYTGRTHQIRVHMSFLGFPIIGDELYGGAKVMKYGIKRQALHSYRLSFKDPFTGENKVFESELPDDILQLITKYGLKY